MCSALFVQIKRCIQVYYLFNNCSCLLYMIAIMVFETLFIIYVVLGWVLLVINSIIVMSSINSLHRQISHAILSCVAFLGHIIVLGNSCCVYTI